MWQTCTTKAGGSQAKVYGGLAPGKGAGMNATAAKAFRSRYGRMKVKVFNNKVREGASKVLWYE